MREAGLGADDPELRSRPEMAGHVGVQAEVDEHMLQIVLQRDRRHVAHFHAVVRHLRVARLQIAGDREHHRDFRAARQELLHREIADDQDGGDRDCPDSSPATGSAS